MKKAGIEAKFYNEVDKDVMATNEIDLIMQLLKDAKVSKKKQTEIFSLLEKLIICNFNLGINALMNQFNDNGLVQLNLAKIREIRADWESIKI